MLPSIPRYSPGAGRQGCYPMLPSIPRYSPGVGQTGDATLCYPAYQGTHPEPGRQGCYSMLPSIPRYSPRASRQGMQPYATQHTKVLTQSQADRDATLCYPAYQGTHPEPADRGCYPVLPSIPRYSPGGSRQGMQPSAWHPGHSLSCLPVHGIIHTYSGKGTLATDTESEKSGGFNDYVWFPPNI